MIKDKVVIITGASSGIGEAAARMLVQNGAKVVLSARREDRLKKIADSLGENAVYMKSDVASLADMQNLTAFAEETFGHIDVFFANAGVMPAGNMSEMKIDDWNSMVDINIKGVLNGIAAALPEFMEQKGGHFIVTSSVAGTKAVPGNAVYCGTKHFVKAMMDSFRMEAVMEGSNIRTTIIYPGAVQTELLNTIEPSETKAMVEEFYRNVGITSDNIAKAVLYAIEQPDNVDISDIIVRPSKEA